MGLDRSQWQGQPDEDSLDDLLQRVSKKAEGMSPAATRVLDECVAEAGESDQALMLAIARRMIEYHDRPELQMQIGLALGLVSQRVATNAMAQMVDQELQAFMEQCPGEEHKRVRPASAIVAGMIRGLSGFAMDLHCQTSLSIFGLAPPPEAEMKLMIAETVQEVGEVMMRGIEKIKQKSTPKPDRED